ncbi:MAG: transposase [Gammaproteobacteria bacterium]|nr:transposase [Gammaproteobacteria bacterium]
MSRNELLKGRYSKKQHIYHVTFCTDKRKQWFNNLYCGRILVQQIKKLHEQRDVNSLAWVIMPDHVHWLFQLENTIPLSTVIKKVKAKSSIEINKLMHHKGSIWQRGFYDHALRNEDNVRQIARYIVANPLRAGIVKNIGDYSLWDAIWLD